MEPSFDTWTSLFLIAVFQGIFLSIMIFIRKSKANSLLGSLILSFSICILWYITYWTNFNPQINWRFNALLGLTYTFGPLFYFYIRSSKREFYFNIWHLIPFILYVVHFQNWNNYPSSWIPNIRSLQPVIQCGHLFLYSLLIIHFIKHNKGYTNGELKLYKWRKKVALAFLLYSLSFLLYFILVWTDLLMIQYDYMISFAAVFFIYFVGYLGFQKPDIFLMYENGRYEKSGLATATSQSILITIKQHLESNKSYLDSNLRLPNLSEKLNISQHYISQAVNEIEGKNFADFINEYRVEEAKLLLIESDKKLIQVAYDSGFNNKNSFNNAFKKVTGIPPSSFKQQITISTK